MNQAFGPRELDALQELASIGCGQAITALGRLCGRRLDMDVPEAWVGAETGAIASFLGALGRDVLAVGVKLEGRLTGDLLLALPEPDAEALAAILGFPVDRAAAGWAGMVGERAARVREHRRQRLRLGGGGPGPREAAALHPRALPRKRQGLRRGPGLPRRLRRARDPVLVQGGGCRARPGGAHPGHARAQGIAALVATC